MEASVSLPRRSLLAEKGDAMPADVGATHFRPEQSLDASQVRFDAEGEPTTKDNPNWQLSALSGLIQRRVLPRMVHRPTTEVANSEATRGTAPKLVPVETECSKPKENAPLILGVPDETLGNTEWRKMTVRIPDERYRALRDLAQLWGTSRQELLYQAITGFLDSTIDLKPVTGDS